MKPLGKQSMGKVNSLVTIERQELLEGFNVPPEDRTFRSFMALLRAFEESAKENASEPKQDPDERTYYCAGMGICQDLQRAALDLQARSTKGSKRQKPFPGE